jgi:hypothetical protein
VDILPFYTPPQHFESISLSGYEQRRDAAATVLIEIVKSYLGFLCGMDGAGKGIRTPDLNLGNLILCIEPIEFTGFTGAESNTERQNLALSAPYMHPLRLRADADQGRKSQAFERRIAKIPRQIKNILWRYGILKERPPLWHRAVSDNNITHLARDFPEDFNLLTFGKTGNDILIALQKHALYAVLKAFSS